MWDYRAGRGQTWLNFSRVGISKRSRDVYWNNSAFAKHVNELERHRDLLKRQCLELE